MILVYRSSTKARFNPICGDFHCRTGTAKAAELLMHPLEVVLD